MVKNLLAGLLLLSCLSTVRSEGLRFLFIGDSITDGNWGNGNGAKPSGERNLWDMNHIYGHGYMYLCAVHFQGDFPEEDYRFFNRGISGNTLDDLENRWDKDVLELRPDVLSVLIGTNDVSVFLKNKNAGGEFDFDKWEKCYRQLLDKALKENPDLKIVLCAPFVGNTGKMKNSTDYEEREDLVRQCARVVERIAKDYDAVYVPFDGLFDELLSMRAVSDTYWIWDGIHPTPAGHKRMADMWIEAVGDRLKLH